MAGRGEPGGEAQHPDKGAWNGALGSPFHLQKGVSTSLEHLPIEKRRVEGEGSLRKVQEGNDLYNKVNVRTRLFQSGRG